MNPLHGSREITDVPSVHWREMGKPSAAVASPLELSAQEPDALTGIDLPAGRGSVLLRSDLQIYNWVQVYIIFFYSNVVDLQQIVWFQLEGGVSFTQHGGKAFLKVKSIRLPCKTTKLLIKLYERMPFGAMAFMLNSYSTL